MASDMTRLGAILGTLFPLALATAAYAGDTPPECPPDGTSLRWEGFALDFFNHHCNSCHNWADYSDVYRNRTLLGDLVRLAVMPPFQHLDAAEISSFEEWIACDLPYDGPSCPPRGTYVSYDSFAASFFEQNCNTCHSKALPEGQRNGAPLGSDFDDLSAIKAHAVEIRDGVLKGSMPPDFAFLLPSDVQALVEWIACDEPEHPLGTLYKRADVNDDGSADITDAVVILSYLFRGGEDLTCLDAADTDASGGLEITDAVYLLRYLFSIAPAPPPPFEICGSLPALGCERFGGCAATNP